MDSGCNDCNDTPIVFAEAAALRSLWLHFCVPLFVPQVCEVGERPDAASGVAECAADCPFPVVTCPLARGVECGSAGSCLSGSAVLAWGCACAGLVTAARAVGAVLGGT